MSEHSNLYYILLWDLKRTTVPKHLANEIQRTLDEIFAKAKANLNMPPSS